MGKIENKLLKPNILKKLNYKGEELMFHFRIWRDVKMGYKATNGEPLKCFKCNSKNMERFGEYTEEYYTVEYSVKCKECGQVLGHWVYGDWAM